MSKNLEFENEDYSIVWATGCSQRAWWWVVAASTWGAGEGSCPIGLGIFVDAIRTM